MLLSYVDMSLYYVCVWGGGGVVVGFNGGKYAISRQDKQYFRMKRTGPRGVCDDLGTGKLETIMTFKSKVIFF